MFGLRRRGFPFSGLLLFAAGMAVAGLLTGSGTFAGLLLLPLLAMKLLFVFLLFGAFARFAGGGFGPGNRPVGPPWGRGGPPQWRGRPERREPTEEEQDRARAEREAREAIDNLFPDPS